MSDEEVTSLSEVLSTVLLQLPTVLITLIVSLFGWNSIASQSWILPRFGRPYGILAHKQALYVTDYSTTSTLLEYSQDRFVEGKWPHPIDHPYGMDRDPKTGYLYVIGSDEVTVLNGDGGGKVSAWRLPELNGRGMKIDHDRLYFTVAYRHKIFVYTLSGVAITTFGASGKNEGQFDQPYGVTIGGGNAMYICDCYNHRIQVLNKTNGNYLRHWGSEGLNEGEFNYPKSIYFFTDRIDKWNLVYVGDNLSVQLFTEEGECLQRLGDKSKGNGRHQFDQVWGISVEDERLYVSDSFNGRIQVFRQQR